MDIAAAIVQRLIEDDEFDYDLPKVKSEVRILPTDNPQEFDVSLITGYGPIYVGTIGVKGPHWVPVRTMNGAGRLYRSKLHFFGPTKEETAMAMVEVLRPIWSRILNRNRNSVMDSEGIDPKDFVAHHFGAEEVIRRVIEENHPNVEVLSVEKAAPIHSPRYEAVIRSRDPQAHPLWHSPICHMIKDIEQKIADVYGWKMRPYRNQEKYPDNIKVNGIAGIKAVDVCYNNADTPGTYILYVDFSTLKRANDGSFDVPPDWDTPYG